MEIKKVYIDIETGVSNDAQQFFKGKVGEFEAPPLKLGRLKDEEKIKEHTEKHKERVAILELEHEKKKEEEINRFLEQSALNALTGRVLAIGIRSGMDNIIISEEDEKVMLETFWENYERFKSEGALIIGTYIKSFDLPFLIRRSWKHGIPKTKESVIEQSNVIDIAEIWRLNVWEDRYIGLNDLCRFFGLPTKRMNGKDFQWLFKFNPSSDKEYENTNEALMYLEDDLKMTEEVYTRIKGLSSR